MPSSKTKVTAILAVYNGGKTLHSCLDTLANQTVPLEIIVVDDGSTDNSRQIAISYSNVTLIEANHGGPALARNLGVSQANGDIVLFVDADMKFDSDYVKDLIVPIKKGNCIGTYTANEKVANWDNVWARCWNWQEGWAPGIRFPANAPEEGTDFRAIIKSEFEKVGGFDNIGYTDTWTLFKKLGIRPAKTMAVCYHKNPENLNSVFVQARWSAKRPYKYGVIGSLYALVRTSLPISIAVGVYKSLAHLEPNFLVFKIVYDIGRFVGILEMIVTGKLAK